MRGKSVYLAGPISGLNYHGATSWRKEVKKMFFDLSPSIEVYSPMRGKEYLHRIESMSNQGHADMNTMSTAKGIVGRDRFDCQQCDAVLMFLLGAGSVSIGTVMEMAWADAARRPVALVMEPGNIHDHAMMTEVATWRPDSLMEAVDILVHFLNP